MSRPAASVVTITRALMELAFLMEKYEPFRDKNFDPALIALAVETLIAIRDGKRLRVRELSDRLQIPRQTVALHCKALAKTARELNGDYRINLHDGNRPLSPDRLCGAFRAATEALQQRSRTKGNSSVSRRLPGLF